MGKAFTRLERSVQGRNPGRTRYVPFPARVAELEKATLEIMAYIATEMATDADAKADNDFVAAWQEFKKHLEGTIV